MILRKLYRLFLLLLAFIAATYLVAISCLFYGQHIYAGVERGQTRAEVEANKGLLRSREVKADFLGGCQFYFQEHLDAPGSKVVSCMILGWGFSVIYDKSDRVVMTIDNYLDG